MSITTSTQRSRSRRDAAIAVGDWLSLGVLVAPIVVLVLNAISILVYVVDLPALDDWDPFYRGTLGSFGLRALFAKGNDSIFPVGRALDALAQQELRGNSIAYQFITMVCLLGGVLLLQWRLLSHVIDDRIIRRCAFGLCALSMMRYTYWGQQNNAYIQGIPILCMLGIMYTLVCLKSRKEIIYAVLGILSAISGMTYISGAVGFIPLGIVLIFFGWTRSVDRLTRSGVVVLSMSVFCTTVQLSFVYAYQGTALHRPDGFITLPTRSDFWFYLLGKVGRSLGILPPVSWPALAITLIASGAVVVLCLRVARSRGDRRVPNPEFWSSVVLCSLTCASFLVMSMIAAGRANLARPESFTGPLKIFEFGFMNRFHFFWLTVIWPWALVCALLVWVGSSDLRRALAICLTVVWLCAAAVGGTFDNAQDYRESEPLRRSQIACLQQKLNDGKGLMCPNVFPVDLSSSFLLATSLNASFTRYLQIAPKPISDKSIPALFRLSGTPQALQPQNARLVETMPGVWKFKSEPDPQLLFKVEDQRLSNCLAVQFSARIKAEHSDMAQLFYTSANEPFFNEQKSQLVPFAADGSNWADVHFVVLSAVGFGSQFRFDPVADTQPFEIGEVEVRCRMGKP